VRLSLVLLSFALIAPGAAADEWDDFLAGRLGDSASYRQARIKYEEARLGRDKLAKPYLPTLTIGTSGQSGLSIQDGAFAGATIAPRLTFAELFGAELSVQTPVLLAKTGEPSLGNPAVSVTRKLFVESGADRDAAEAAYISAKASLRDAESAVRLQLVTEVLNAVYYGSLLEANARNLAVLERGRMATPDDAVSEAALRASEKQILQATKSILSARASLAALDPQVKEAAERLYPVVKKRGEEWIAVIPAVDAPLPESQAIAAIERRLAAARSRAALWMLPYLPNPSLTGQVGYDLAKEELTWGLSLQFSFTVLDKGERALSALQRRENAELERIAVQAAKKNLADGIRQARERLELLALDARIKALELADAQETAALRQVQYERGFATAEQLESGRIDLATKELEAMSVEHDTLIQKLRLAQYYVEGRL